MEACLVVGRVLLQGSQEAGKVLPLFLEVGVHPCLVGVP
jgi:hypothetical protein